MAVAVKTSQKKSATRSGAKAVQREQPKKTGSSAIARQAKDVIMAGQSTPAEALRIFDALPIVDLDFMIGRWQGSGIHTDHPMDGLLENYAWFGKEFIDADHVHPLLFTNASGSLFIVNPARMPMGLALTQQWLKRPFMRGLFRLFRFLLTTAQTKARLRMTELRGKVSATMCYDDLPIHDCFRRVDPNTVLGYMDFKHMDAPFFFALRRTGD